jgi:hypothetical protein
MTPKGAEIRARSSAAIFYGVQTLLQMVEGTGAEAVLPAAEIKDWPVLTYRGVMIDFSEGELIRVSEVQRQLDLMARFKANQYYFYCEASIEFEGYDVVNPNGRYSREEVRQVIEYARQRHIDVIPCMELYGHMHNLFRFEKYADLGLPRYGGEYDPRNPRMYEILDNWIEQTAKLFPSPWYHIGFDEPWSKTLSRRSWMCSGISPSRPGVTANASVFGRTLTRVPARCPIILSCSRKCRPELSLARGFTRSGPITRPLLSRWPDWAFRLSSPRESGGGTSCSQITTGRSSTSTD